MSERLEKLKLLWNRQLEGDLPDKSAAELNELLQDPDLVESFTLDRESNAGSEGVPQVDWSRVDATVAKKFRRQTISWGSALAVVVIAAGLGFAGYHWVMNQDFATKKKKRAPSWMLVVDSQAPAPAAKTEVRDRPKAAPSVASKRKVTAPPSASDLDVFQGPRGVEIKVKLNRTAETEVAVIRKGGATIRLLHKGRLKAGEHHFVWTGLDDQGANPGAGKYEIVVRGEGPTLRSGVEIIAAP